MIESSEDLLLSEADFPSHYQKFAHPEDYIIQSTPIEPECIFRSCLGHNQLIYRTSIYAAPEKYFSLSFICNTGAPKHIYLVPKAIKLFQLCNRIHTDNETDLSWITVSYKKCPISVTPLVQQPANILGLKMLCRLGLQLSDHEFEFNSSPPFF